MTSCRRVLFIVTQDKGSMSLSVVIMATWIGNQSERSKFGLDQSESRISPM